MGVLQVSWGYSYNLRDERAGVQVAAFYITRRFLAI